MRVSAPQFGEFCLVYDLDSVEYLDSLDSRLKFLIARCLLIPIPSMWLYFRKYLKNSTLQDLNISDNAITDKGINELAVLFLENPHYLQVLNLSKN